MEPQLPSPRGPIQPRVVKAVSRPSGPFTLPPVRTDDALTDEDLQLALYCCYELHYQGFGRLSDDWEWNPGLLRLRNELEEAFEQHLRSALTNDSDIAATDVPDALWRLTRENGFSLSGWLLEHGSRFHAREIAIHRSGYQLKEADPHTWAIPRLRGRAKAAMVTIQTDEYGNGVVSSMHSVSVRRCNDRPRPRSHLWGIPRPSTSSDAGHDEPDLDVRFASPAARRRGWKSGWIRDELCRSDVSVQCLAQIAWSTETWTPFLRHSMSRPMRYTNTSR